MERLTPCPSPEWERDWIKTEEDHLEREPQLKVVGVMTCRGEIFTHVAFKAKDGEIALAQCQIANTHDTLVHKKSEPCHKRFFTRP